MRERGEARANELPARASEQAVCCVNRLAIQCKGRIAIEEKRWEGEKAIFEKLRSDIGCEIASVRCDFSYVLRECADQ